MHGSGQMSSIPLAPLCDSALNTKIRDSKLLKRLAVSVLLGRRDERRVRRDGVHERFVRPFGHPGRRFWVHGFIQL